MYPSQVLSMNAFNSRPSSLNFAQTSNFPHNIPATFIKKIATKILIASFLFGLVGFYGISTILAYLMPNSLYKYILDIYDLFGFMCVEVVQISLIFFSLSE